MRSIAGAFRRRFWTFVSVAVLVFLAVLVVTLLLRPEYRAAAQVKIDPTRSAATGLATDRANSPGDTAAVDTEVAVIKSRDLAETVVRDLKLDRDPTLTVGLPPAGSSPAAIESRVEAVAGRLLGGLSVDRQSNTYVVRIGYRSPNAELAARVANAVADHYINNSVGMRTGTASQQSEMLDQRLEGLANEVREVEARIAQARANAGIVEGGTQGTITDQQVGPLASQLATAESSAAEARSQLAAAEAQIRSGKLENVAGVLNSPVVADLRRQRAQVVNNMGEVQARYGARHPEMIRVQQQLKSIDAQIGDEAKRITESLKSDAAAADARAASLRASLNRLRGEQATNTRASVTVESLEHEAEAKRAAYNAVAQQAQQASQIKNNSLPQAQVIEQATKPGSPAYPNKRLLLGAGFLLALLAGASTVGVLEMLTQRLRTAGDVEHKLGLPLFAAIPRLSGGDLKGHDRKRPADVLITKKSSSYAEAFRSIRSALLLAADGKPPKVTAIVSTLPDEGKTTCAVSLARVMALSGERVLLVDGDLRRGGVRHYVDHDLDHGFAAVLTGEEPPEVAITPDVIPGLDLLTVTKPLFTSADLFGTTRMQALLARWRSEYDRVIIDTPPLLGIADARTLAKQADAVVLVVKWNKTPSDAIVTALSSLQLDDANVVGAAFAMVDRKSASIGAYYYSRKYAAYYSE